MRRAAAAVLLVTMMGGPEIAHAQWGNNYEGSAIPGPRDSMGNALEGEIAGGNAQGLGKWLRLSDHQRHIIGATTQVIDGRYGQHAIVPEDQNTVLRIAHSVGARSDDDVALVASTIDNHNQSVSDMNKVMRSLPGFNPLTAGMPQR
jgi:hypothetical protein